MQTHTIRVGAQSVPAVAFTNRQQRGMGRAITMMEIKADESRAPEPLVRLIEALANYAATPDQLVAMATKLWPQLRVYRGHTHLRLTPTGDVGSDSIHVELT